MWSLTSGSVDPGRRARLGLAAGPGSSGLHADAVFNLVSGFQLSHHVRGGRSVLPRLFAPEDDFGPAQLARRRVYRRVGNIDPVRPGPPGRRRAAGDDDQPALCGGLSAVEAGRRRHPDALRPQCHAFPGVQLPSPGAGLAATPITGPGR